MNLLIRSILGFLLVISTLSSCSPKSPHEARSPCVSNPEYNPYFKNPCIRKPLNANGWDIV